MATYISLGEVFVARHGELIVGYAQIVESEDPREFELKSLAVIEARQGEGIGRDLVGAVVARRTTCAGAAKRNGTGWGVAAPRAH